jgi:hypothetical protein
MTVCVIPFENYQRIIERRSSEVIVDVESLDDPVRNMTTIMRFMKENQILSALQAAEVESTTDDELIIIQI